MSTIEKIFQFIDYLGISVNEFSKKIDVSNGYFAKQRLSNGSISSNIIEKIVINYPNLNVEWLFTGIGNIVKDNYTFAAHEPQTDYNSTKNVINRIAEIAKAKGFESIESLISNGLKLPINYDQINELTDSSPIIMRIITSIADTYDDINCNWLLTGKGNITNDTSNKKDDTHLEGGIIAKIIDSHNAHLKDKDEMISMLKKELKDLKREIPPTKVGVVKTVQTSKH